MGLAVCCSFEDAKAALKEEVATKQRELQRLRQEKHDLKAQSEANMNSLVRSRQLLECLSAPQCLLQDDRGLSVSIAVQLANSLGSAHCQYTLWEEKAKLECQHRLAQQDLLLRKDLDAAGLSEVYRRLSAASQVLIPRPRHALICNPIPRSLCVGWHACRRMLAGQHYAGCPRHCKL